MDIQKVKDLCTKKRMLGRAYRQSFDVQERQNIMTQIISINSKLKAAERINNND